ncbi:MAG: DUF1614 domain-containing protein [Desulfitobacteriaceae bacterium]|nr:DUF1614 domain-containing protein [Desulfitobacteriaceae bacterium]MDD4751753.1 DUF1614 domain-containing protein [Desulfitobacteriaceae bacterium]
MPRVPIGMIVLVVLSVLIYFGLAQRVLDRMRLTDKGALAVIAAIIVGSFIDIPLTSGEIASSINVGGAIVPVGFSVYLLATAGTSKELGRSLLGTVVTGGLLVAAMTLLSEEPENMLIDPLWVFPIIAGLVAYLLGRSRRGAFISATLGILLADIAFLVWLYATGYPGRVDIGGAGALDSLVIAGIIAVLLAEFIGEFRERLQGGPVTEGRPKELLQNLRNPSHEDKGGNADEK